MAYSDIPTGPNGDYYVSGRGRALYEAAGPLPGNAPKFSPVWWSNEGNYDAWMGLPSRVGVEAQFTGPNGPLPVKIGVVDPATGTIPPNPYTQGGQQGNQLPVVNVQWPAPNPGIVRIPAWADDYWTAYLWALQDQGTAAQRQAQGNMWTANYQKGLRDGLLRSLPSDPTGFYPTPAQAAQSPVAIPTQGPPAPPWAPPPVAQAPAPPPMAIAAYMTKEVYGMQGRRKVPLFGSLGPDSLLGHLLGGGGVHVTANPSEGFGLAGTPGAWAQAAGGNTPQAYGLDPGIGVVAWDGSQARPLDSNTLQRILGPNWRQTIQAAA